MSMHHPGGSAERKKALRCDSVRQRGTTALARVTSTCVSAKMFHTRAVLSAEAVTMRLPSGLNAASYTLLSWVLIGSLIGWPVVASQRRTVLSEDAVTMRLPSGLNA